MSYYSIQVWCLTSSHVIICHDFWHHFLSGNWSLWCRVQGLVCQGHVVLGWHTVVEVHCRAVSQSFHPPVSSTLAFILFTLVCVAVFYEIMSIRSIMETCYILNYCDYLTCVFVTLYVHVFSFILASFAKTALFVRYSTHTDVWWFSIFVPGTSSCIIMDFFCFHFKTFFWNLPCQPQSIYNAFQSV